MEWIRQKIYEIDSSLSSEDVSIIIALTYDDMVYNFTCTQKEFYQAIEISEEELSESIKNIREKIIIIIKISTKMLKRIA